MRPIMKDVAEAFCMGFLLPGILLNLGVMWIDGGREEAEALPAQTEPVAAVQHLPMRLRRPEGTTEEMDMDAYLTGVVLAEMPASFEEDALKAQAVAARTYTRKAYLTGGKHGDGSVCTDASCCQAYLTEEAYRSRGGTEEGLEKVRRAVLQTSGMCLTYEGALIEATYFSSSGGCTEDAVAVWGTDFPYLQAQVSPVAEGSPYDTDTVTFTAEQFLQALDEDLTGPPENWFGTAVYTEGGGVSSLTIGETVYSGVQLRSLLNLRSTAFTIETEGQTITITTHGYGHRVGMSQYGADAMAAAGSSWEEILAFYYPGTALTLES